jgi:hypothetical protein
LQLLDSILFGVPFLAIHSTIILDDFGSLVVRTIWCFTVSLGHGYTNIRTATFEILVLVQDEKEGIHLASTLVTLQYMIDQLVGSIYTLLFCMNFKGRTMVLIYKSLYSIICILSTRILDVGYAASLDICQILMRYNYIHFGLTLFLSF